MNNTQLYLSIGVPTLTMILAWLSNRSDINGLNDKVDRLGETLNGKTDRHHFERKWQHFAKITTKTISP